MKRDSLINSMKCFDFIHLEFRFCKENEIIQTVKMQSKQFSVSIEIRNKRKKENASNTEL